MELYQAIVRIEQGDNKDGSLQDRANQIQSGLEELVKSVNERCKQYGLRAKPSSLVELPFGWQAGIQEGATDWEKDWDKFEGEGFTFVKELTLDVQNVIALPKLFSEERNFDEPSWGKFDNHDTDSVWGFDSEMGKEMDHERHDDNPLFGLGDFNIKPK
ncbi:calcium-binding EF hand family protein [Corchorus olitorius]|uniref:Calcium-binding EF hand family protein n=1 Tax=Corchorus olitorius TaxID=93759 RepID=A0A1R3KJM0_9ROSI|nr:calcium-binding EF hand family protein [Corchorus olitorius]